eukprot:PhF_6_TR44188/c1_g1_i2/m.67756
MFRLRKFVPYRSFPKGTDLAKGAFIGNYPSDGASYDPKEFHNGVPYMTPKMTLTQAAEFLTKYDVGAVPVLDTTTKTLVGMISERDLARKIPSMTPTTTVADVMAQKVVTCTPGLSLHDALVKMDTNNFRHLPVVDPQTGDVVGLLSMRDVVHQQLVRGVEEVDDFMNWVTK